MRIQSAVLSAITAAATLGFGLVAKADTVPASCDLYRPNSNYPDFSSNCTFSQRQGYVSIELQENGAHYEFEPIANAAPGNFQDQHGNPVYRQAGLGNDGVIFQFVDGYKLYVFWENTTFPNSTPNLTPATSGLAVAPGTRVGTLSAHEQGSHITLRSQPTVRSRSLGYGLAGDRVQIYLCQQDTDTPGSQLNWCNVQFLVSGANGWIRSDFIIFPSDGL